MSPILQLIVSCFLFSILAALIKYNAVFIHPFEQAFFRNFLGAIILIPFFIKQKKLINKKSNLWLLFLRGLFGGLTMLLIFTAYSLIPLTQAMAISFSTPLFMYFGSIIFLKENSNNEKTFYTLLGFFLTIIIIRPDLSIQIGTFISLISSITHAIAGLLVKKLSKDENVITLMFSLVIMMAPITFIPSVYVWESPFSFFILLNLIIIAIVATLGNFFWTNAISLSKVTNLMPFDFSKLIFATILGLVFFDEKIDALTIICGTGILLCNTFILKKAKNENT